MNSQNKQDIAEWQDRIGARFTRPAGHALRLLHEVVELCLAAGADGKEIMQRVGYELLRGEKGGGSAEEMRKELSDVAINVEVLNRFLGGMLDTDVAAKLVIIDVRQWELDRDGVPWRPGRSPWELLERLPL